MLFFIDQHGCAKNQVDAELLVGILRDRGWQSAASPDDADLIIVNSCGFINSAKKESIDAVITARTAYPKAKVLLAGCLSERYAEDLAENLVEADAFFGNGDLSRLPEILDTLFPPKEGKNTSHSLVRPVLKPAQTGVCGGNRPELLNFPRSAYVKITEGCDNWCSFCAIPIIRGALRSRPISDIVAECAALVARNVWELNLIGQDLAAYGTGSGDAVSKDTGSVSPLSRLLQAISALRGDFRVRLLYIHPDHFPRDILPVMTADSRFFPYFDIPFQSGDREIIHAMNRKGDPDSYRQLVSDIRSAFETPDNPYGRIALRTTLLTGFPGETDEAFERTARFLSDIRSTWSGSFVWSREEGTAADSMKKRVSGKQAKERQDVLKAIQERITPEELTYFVGKQVEVLVEELIPLDEEPSDGADIPASRLALGRSWFQAPDVDGSVVLQYEDTHRDLSGSPVAAGSVVRALVTAVNGVDVQAVVR